MNLRHISRLVQYCFRRFPLFYVAIAVSLIAVALELVAMASLFPLSEFAMGRGLPENGFWFRALSSVGLTPSVGTLLTIFLSLLLLQALTLLASNASVAWLSRQLIAHFSSQAFSTFVKTLSFAEVNKRSIGYFINLAGDEANRASQIVISLIHLVPAVALSGLYFLVIAYKSPAVVLALSLLMVVAGLSLTGALRASHRLGTMQRNESRVLNSHFLDALNSLRSVRALGAEGFVVSRYRAMISHYARTCFKGDLFNYLSRFLPVLALLGIGVVWAVVYAGSEATADSLPFLVVMLVLLMRFFPVLGQAVDIFMRVVGDFKAGHDIGRLLEASQTSGQPASNAGAPLDRIHSIQLKGVSFSYSPGRPVLANVQLIFEAGQSYAIVGASGGGKSTIIDLLLRFYEPQSGAILVNGQDIREFQSAALRLRIAVVEQHARIFNDTVFNNVAFGRAVDLARVRRACALACIDEDALKLPQGYDTVISYQGANFSGGQRQRIALARGLLSEADVLILDESTNALDHATRDAVVGNILREFDDRIVIFAIHDRSVAQRVDVVYDLPQLNATTREHGQSVAILAEEETPNEQYFR